MYLFEAIFKFLTKKLRKDEYDEVENTPLIASEGEFIDSANDYENCEHVFMPIDSTGKTLACTKCGQLIKKSEFKKKNPFIK